MQYNHTIQCKCNPIDEHCTLYTYGKEYEQLSKTSKVFVKKQQLQQQYQQLYHHQPSIVHVVVIAAVHQEQVFVVLWFSFIWLFNFTTPSGDNICTS